MKHISYSELKIWSECPFKHKLIYIDKIRPFKGNEFTAFGKALHELCEYEIAGILDDPEDFFDLAFERELESISLEENKLITEMRTQAKNIIPEITPLPLKRCLENMKYFLWKKNYMKILKKLI